MKWAGRGLCPVPPRVLPAPSTRSYPVPESHSPLLLPPIWLSGRPACLTLSTQTGSPLTLPLCYTAFVSKQEGSEVVKRLRRYLDPGLG